MPCILILDNNNDWFKSLSKGLKLADQCDCNVDYVDSFESAKDSLFQKKYDLVIINHMPDTTVNHPVYEGLYFIDYIDSSRCEVFTILVYNDPLGSKEKYCNISNKYKDKVDQIFVGPIGVKDLTDSISLLLGMIGKFANGYALLVGVGYDSCLPKNVNDVTSIYHLLTNPRLAAYPQEQVHVLTENTSTKNDIILRLDTLADQVGENKEATVWIYYSGHGFRCEQDQSYFLFPYGYSLQQLEETTISSQELATKIEAIKAKKIMIWLDCCHDGRILSSNLDGLLFRESPPPKGVFEGLTSGVGRVVVTSCKENQRSYILNGETNSVFTTCLLEVLQEESLTDADDEYIRFFQVLSYLYRKVPESVKIQPQNPVLVSAEAIDDNFAVCCRPSQTIAIIQPDDEVVQNNQIQVDDFYQMGISITRERQIKVLENQINAKYDLLELLYKKIATFEKDRAIIADAQSKFNLDHNISTLKEKIRTVEQDIDKLDTMLSISRQNSIEPSANF